jgi:hypothetical protein
MKQITLIGLLSLFMAQPVFAIAPVTLSQPSPAIASSYATNSSTTITYTITNNVPNLSFPISVNGISGPVTRTTVSNDCGSALPKGPSTCQLGISIAPTSANAGNAFNQTLSINYQGRTPLESPVSFSVPSTPSVGTTVLVAAGTNETDGVPLVASSSNSGTTWSVKPISSNPSAGVLNAANCTGTGSTALCVAAGTDNSTGAEPMVVESIDGGTTWSIQTIIGNPNGELRSAKCIGSGASALCIAVGSVSGAGPVLVQSTNGGATWSVQTIAGNPTGGSFFGSSCTGSGASAICIAVGRNNPPSGNAPLIAQSTDGGATWAVKTITGNPTSGLFNGASCTGSGASALCVAVGRDTTGGQPPLVAQSSDGGTTWAVKTITNNPTSGTLRSVSCIGSGVTALCVAAGSDITSGSPLLVQSADGGTTWAVKPVSGNPPTGALFAASCTGSGANALCIAAGQSGSSPTIPYLAQSTDGGTTWSTKSVTGITDGAFAASSCIGSGASAICFAAGQTFSDTALIAQSTDGGTTWSVVSTIIDIPAEASFNGTGIASGSTSLSFKHKRLGMRNQLQDVIN